MLRMCYFKTVDLYRIDFLKTKQDPHLEQDQLINAILQCTPLRSHHSSTSIDDTLVVGLLINTHHHIINTYLSAEDATGENESCRT